MVYKRYIKVGGKKYGPYIYGSKREKGKIVSEYVGKTESVDEISSVKSSVKSPSFSNFYLVVLLFLVVVLAVLFLRPTGKATLDVQGTYSYNAPLSGVVSMAIQNGDSLQKDSSVVLSLSNNGNIVAEQALTLEQFINGQVAPVEIYNSSEICQNQTTENIVQNCTLQDVNVTDENGRVVNVTQTEVCENQTVESVETNCTNQTTGDYFYQTPGVYSRNIQDLMNYTFSQECNYVLTLSIPSANVSVQKSLSVSAPVVPAENQTQPETNQTNQTISQTNESAKNKLAKKFGIQSNPNIPINFTNPTPLNGSYLSANNFIVNVTVSGTNLLSLFINLYNSTGIVSSSITGLDSCIPVSTPYVWVVNHNDNTTIKLNETNGNTIGTYAVGSNPESVAVDSGGNVWVANCGSNNVTKLDSNGNTIGTYAVGSCPDGIAVDSAGSVWVANYNSNTTTKLGSNGAIIGTYPVGKHPTGIAVDASGNAWVTSTGNVTKVNPGGTINGTYAVGSFFGIAVDASGNIWVASGDKNVTKLNSNGDIIGSYNYGENSPEGIAVDASGNVWVANEGSNSVTELNSNGGLIGNYWPLGTDPYFCDV